MGSFATGHQSRQRFTDPRVLIRLGFGRPRVAISGFFLQLGEIRFTFVGHLRKGRRHLSIRGARRKAAAPFDPAADVGDDIFVHSIKMAEAGRSFRLTTGRREIDER